MSKADIRLQFVSNALVLDKLFAAMRRDRMGFLRQRLQVLDDNIGHALDLLQARQAGIRICQGDNGMKTPSADDRIDVPVAQTLTSIHNIVSLVAAHPVFERSTLVVTPVARFLRFFPGQPALAVQGIFDWHRRW
jgi:hypothetical protein